MTGAAGFVVADAMLKAADVELVLAPGSTPPLRLGLEDPSRLGLDSWLGVVRDRETRIQVQIPPRDNPVPQSPNPGVNSHAS